MTEYLTQKRKVALRVIMWLSLSGLCAAVLSLAGIFLYLDPQVPRAESYRNVQLAIPLRVYAKDGSLLAEYGERRLIPVTLDEVPQEFINALLDTEDKRFYEHSGIDFISLTNDTFSLLGTLITDGELGPGASTITMQLARNVSFSLERRFIRKFKEMLLALKIERELSKDEILELYINVVPYGKRAYGAQAAALTYYGKTLNNLNLAQLAMLAGIPQAPSAGNPINGPERAIARRNVVLSRMFAQGSIEEPQYQAAIEAPITAQIFGREIDTASPYAAEWVRQQAVALLPDLYTGGYEIYTTIDSELQDAAIKALRKGLQQYDRDHGYRGAEAQINEADIDLLLTHSGELEAAIAQLDVINSAEELPLSIELTDAIHTFLSDYDSFGGLTPAVVLAATATEALAQLPDRSLAKLLYADAQWARPYIDVDRRAPLPERFDELLRPGDLIRLKPSQANAAEERPVEERSGEDIAAEVELAEAGLINEEVEEQRWQLSQLPEVQGAIVALDPNTGHVRSLVGGFDFFRNQFNHALQAARQPGSGFKPLVYSAAIEAGVTPADIFLDAPLVFDDDNLETQYRPDNDNNRYNGPTRLREALYRSINLVSIRVLLQIGAEAVLEHVANFGLNTRDYPRNTQLAIGGGTIAITPLDMARAYAVFANGGHLIDPNIVDHIKDANGEIIFQANHPIVCSDCEDGAELHTQSNNSLLDLLGQLDPDTEASESAERQGSDAEIDEALESAIVEESIEAQRLEGTLAASEAAAEADADSEESEITPIIEPIIATRVLDERNAFIMHSMLRDVIRRGTGVRAKSLNRSDIGGKTGTTNEAADTWFNGFNSDLVTTVWVGFSNHEPLGRRAYGSNTPLPIWIDFMEVALRDTQENFPTQPANLLSTKIDPETGEQAMPGQANAIFEYFLSEHPPKQSTRVSNPSQPTPGTDEEIKAVDLF